MIETGANEVAKEKLFDAFVEGQKVIDQIVAFIKNIQKEIGKPKSEALLIAPGADFKKEILEKFADMIAPALYQKDHNVQTKMQNNLFAEVAAYVKEKYPADSNVKKELAFAVIDSEMEDIFKKSVLEKDERPDGRKLDEVRPISCVVGLLPRTHGSALFTRGETQALSIVTLGGPGMEQVIDTMELDEKKRFMHHYNFPPFSVGEVKPMRGPGRRDIGHGALVEKALTIVAPDKDSFPYTIRTVSEILSSNGSSSMASVSASSLAMMDAGVPIKFPAAGIAIGLMSDEKGNYKILTDIQGPEDHHGDMDFKIAGTKNGVTAIQMDVKIEGVSEKIIKESLERAKKARLEILTEMEKVLPQPRPELSPWAPRILVLQVNPDKIREIIGPGGKIINAIIDECGVLIDIDDSGKVFVTAEKEEAALKAVEWIKNIIREVVVGEVFQGKIKRILNFGAFAEILPGQEGMIHISQLAPYRVNKVEDIVKIGDIVSVKVISIDEQGRINLSLKEVGKK